MAGSMDEIEQMRRVNDAQRRYYEKTDAVNTSRSNSYLTNLYRRLRRRALRPMKSVGLQSTVDKLHREWLPDRVGVALDLGPGGETDFSIEVARQAEEYVAVDLSQSRIDRLRERLNEAEIRNYELICGDFLDSEFPREDFDLVYARSVIHHFRHLRPFLDLLHGRMAPHGVVLTYDPLNTWGPMIGMRAGMDCVRDDAAWEHPFNRDSLQAIRDRFSVEEVRGLLGKSKWAMLIGLFDSDLARKKAEEWHVEDLRERRDLSSATSCLQVAMRLVKSTP